MWRFSLRLADAANCSGPHLLTASVREDFDFSSAVRAFHNGEVVFAVVAENSTHEPHRLLASSIGVAIPADRNTYGYLSEHHSFGETEDTAGEYAEELAAEMHH